MGERATGVQVPAQCVPRPLHSQDNTHRWEVHAVCGHAPSKAKITVTERWCMQWLYGVHMYRRGSVGVPTSTGRRQCGQLQGSPHCGPGMGTVIIIMVYGLGTVQLH